MGDMLVKRDLRFRAFYDTLRIPLPISEGKVEPPWAQPQFSYRFSGLPPVEAYDPFISWRMCDGYSLDDC